MNAPLLLLLILTLPGGSTGPQDSEADEDDLPRLETRIVTATLSPHTSIDTPYSAEAIPAAEIERRAYRTTPQVLRDVSGVMVQETAHGHGSPYIRGFTSLRTVFLIDGIRLNNSVFRTGPNQYWNTVDPLSVERFEIVKGPSSVLHGSDAIGGAVGAFSRNPDTYDVGFAHEGRLHYRYSSAERAHVGRLEGSATMDDSLGILVGVSGKDFGDVRGGPDVRTQPETGYDEWDLDVKVERFLDPSTRLVVAHQRVRQEDVPRTHKTIWADSWEGTTVGSDLRRDLDQERDLTYVQLRGEELGGWIDDYHLSLSWHGQEEERDRIKGSGSRSKQGFEVGTLGVFAQLGSETSVGHVSWGFDLYRDHVDSFKDGNPIQGPVADDATYDLLGAFVQDELDITDRLTCTLGVRLQHAAVDANSVQDPVTDERMSIDEDWNAVVGSARFLYRIAEETLHLFGGVSQGFRAPNLSDLTRFDSARSDEFEIPAPHLDPERYTSWELGVKQERENLTAQSSVFYTDVSDQIVRFPTGNQNEEDEWEVTKDNVGDGYVFGVELGAAWEVVPCWTLFGNATWLEGKVDTYPTSDQVEKREYVDRLMPPTAQLGLRWEGEEARQWFEALATFADDADRLSTRDESDTSRIPPGGTPAYGVLHLRGGWRVNEHADVRVGLENVTDEDYRIHGSGLNRPGRSLLFGLTLRR